MLFTANIQQNILADISMYIPLDYFVPSLMFYCNIGLPSVFTETTMESVSTKVAQGFSNIQHFLAKVGSITL